MKLMLKLMQYAINIKTLHNGAKLLMAKKAISMNYSGFSSALLTLSGGSAIGNMTLLTLAKFLTKTANL